MTSNRMRWHLARDNETELAKFCEENKVNSSSRTHTFNDGQHDYWQMDYIFDNGGFITVELLHGDTKSYSVADHFQVVDYDLGDA